MRSAPPGWLPDARTGPEALIKEARRRQRRRWLAAGVAVAAVLAGVAGVAAGVAGHPPGRPGPRSHPGSPAPIPRSIGTTLVMWPAGFGQCCGPVAVDNLGTGRLAQSRQPAIGAGDFQPLLAHVGRWLVYVDDGVTTAIADDLTGRPHVLEPTPFFAPAAAPGRVWLFQSQHGRQSPIRAWTVSLSGGPRSRPVTLPAGAYLPAVRGTDAGLLLQVPRGLALWNSGSALAILPSSPDSADGFDATSRLVAYGTGCTSHTTAPDAPQDPDAAYDTCRALQVLDVVTGKLTSFPAPPDTAGWVPNGFNLVSAISHDGQMIAAYAAIRPQRAGQVRLYVMRIAGPSSQAVPVPSSTAYLFARTAWSADDTWLLYQGPGGHLWAYQVTSGQTRASSTPCCQYTVMAAVPSRGG
ncbi:MAG TPA: hypothetical protein VN597_05800 [Streptosporangiaceae bacterium]|nr:hypothetical protein [Streptosporangiaceae bacterium]